MSIVCTYKGIEGNVLFLMFFRFERVLHAQERLSVSKVGQMKTKMELVKREETITADRSVTD